MNMPRRLKPRSNYSEDKQDQYISIGQIIMDILKAKRPPGITSEDDMMDVISSFSEMLQNVPYEFFPKDALSYEVFMQACFEKAYVDTFDLSKGSNEWARVADMFCSQVKFDVFELIIEEVYADNTLVEAS